MAQTSCREAFSSTWSRFPALDVPFRTIKTVTLSVLTEADARALGMIWVAAWPADTYMNLVLALRR